MRIKYVCKCGLENYNRNDWVSHWKYGVILTGPNMLEKYGKFLCEHPKLRAVYMFLLTKAEFSK